MTHHHAGGERGFALLAVLLVMALLGVVGAEFAYSMRLEANAVRAWRDGIAAMHLAEAGVEQAIREIVADWQQVGIDESGTMTFYRSDRTERPRLQRDRVAFGPGHFSYRISDEQGRININNTDAAQTDRLHRLLQHLGLDKQARDVIIDSLADWRDANEEHRLHGAESDDYYLKLPVPYRSHNANLDSIRELLQIRGVTPALYHGTDGKPGLADVVTAMKGSGSGPVGAVNINTASELVLRAYGLSDAEVTQIMQTRREVPYFATPGQFGARGFGVNTQTFRIEAEGLVDGRVQARVTAVVQRAGNLAATGAAVAFLEWSAGR